MHTEARSFCQSVANEIGAIAGNGLDIGGQNVNGHCRDLWPHLKWTIIDPALRVGLDNDGGELIEVQDDLFVSADATLWQPTLTYDLVLCTEVFEHVQDWIKLIELAEKALRIGGLFVITCASIGRTPHSAHDGGMPYADEWYKNLSAEELGDQLLYHGFTGEPIYNPSHCDLYVRAVKA